MTTKVRKDMRSRHAKYVSLNYSHVRICKQRDCEPSRLTITKAETSEKEEQKASGNCL